MSWKKFTDLTQEERMALIQNQLDYLEKEGVVLKTLEEKYRLKTEKEIQQEIEDIFNS